MATYSFRCVEHGPVDVSLPMGAATREAPCPACGAASARLFTAPMLARVEPRVSAALARADASRDSPATVTRLPSATGYRPAQLDPSWSRLPRP